MLSNFRRSSVAVLLALGISAAFVGLGAAAANAHDQLVSTDPAAQSTQKTAPSKISLEFSESVIKLGTKVTVTSAGDHYETGKTKIKGSVVTQRVNDLPNGSYKVTWRVTSADGHPVGGSFKFKVADKSKAASASATVSSATQTPAATSTATSTASASTSQAASTAGQPGSTANPPWVGWVSGGAIIVGIALMAVMFARQRRARLNAADGAKPDPEDAA